MYYFQVIAPLVLGLALGTGACSSPTIDQDAGITMATKEDAATMQYNTPGQTDDDHLYLEEVLGEDALAEVKGWNSRTA